MKLQHLVKSSRSYFAITINPFGPRIIMFLDCTCISVIPIATISSVRRMVLNCGGCPRLLLPPSEKDKFYGSSCVQNRSAKLLIFDLDIFGSCFDIALSGAVMQPPFSNLTEVGPCFCQHCLHIPLGNGR